MSNLHNCTGVNGGSLAVLHKVDKNLDFYYESCEFNPYQVSGTTSHTIRITYMCATSDHAIKSKVCVIK